MRRLSLLLPLLCAVAFTARAHPYSKIADSIQLGDGFTSKKSSSNAQSSSYSTAKRDTIEIGGVHNGQTFGGSKSSAYKSSGSSHSESSSYSSASVNGAIPIGLVQDAGLSGGQSKQVGYGAHGHPTKGFLTLQHGFNAAVGGGHSGGQNAGNTQYWWMGPNSPFEANKISGCTANGCVASASYSSNIGLSSGNPFLTGAGFGAGQSAAGSGFNAGHTATGSGFNAGHTATGSGFNTGHTATGSGFNVGQSTAGSAFNAGHTATGSGFNAGHTTTGSGFNAGQSAIGSGFNAGQSITGSGFNAGQSITGSGFNAGQSATGSGFNAGQSVIESGFNAGQSATGSGFNAGHTATGSGFNAGHTATGSGFNAGQSATGSSFNAGQSTIESGFNAGQSATGSSFNAGQSTIDSGFNAGQSVIGSGFNAGHTASGSGFNAGHTTNGGGFNANAASSAFASAGSTNSANGANAIDLSKNPFLTGAAAGAVASSSSGGNYGFSAGSSASNYGSTGVSSDKNTQTNLVGAGNPFFNTVSSGSGYEQQHSSQGQENTYTDQQSTGFSGYPVTKPIPETTDGGLKVSCSGEGNICVSKKLCSAGGYVFNKHLTQVRSGPQVCNTKTEVCCTLRSQTSDQSQAGTFVNIKEQKNSNGGIFGNENSHQTDLLTAGEAGGQLFENSNNGADSTGYLPPIGSEPSENVPSFSRPPGEEPDNNGGANNPVPTSIFPPAPAPAPQIGCAAALICVEKQFCTLGGVITTVPQIFSSQDAIRGVPLSSCKNPDNGIIGKCCRDPNYVDPWPAGNLPANYSGGFDEQGFPTILNIAKTRPNKKQPPIKTSFTVTRPPVAVTSSPPPPFVQYPNQVSNVPRPTVTDNYFMPAHVPNNPRPIINNNNYPIPVQVQNVPKPITNNNYQTPTQVPNVPRPNNNYQTPNLVPQPTYTGGGVKSPAPFQIGVKTPGSYKKPKIETSGPYPAGNPTSIPFTTNYETPYVKNNYDTSSSNQNTIIAPHVPGSQCGRRNNVQRPNSLTDVDVAFGEIPWQAMVLDNRSKKLLCSGAIIASNAVVTAARCVEGFRATDVSIKSGEWKLGYELKHEEPLPFEIIKVASIAPYPAYSTGNPGNDIAILFLEHDMKLDQHVDVLCLPEGQPRPPQPGSKCIATGWGKVVLQVNAAGALMHSIDVDVLGNDQCAQRVAGAETIIGLDDSLVCAKARKNNNNMCQVDFGGPLACDRGDGFYELAGIYNQDTGCLPTNQVATFATIPTPWVKEMMSKVPQYYNSFEKETPSNVGQIIHNHGPNEPCDCQRSEYAAASNQYLPPSP